LQYTGFTAADQTLTRVPSMNAKMAAARAFIRYAKFTPYLAEETGGIAIKNNNDLGGRRARRPELYLIAYERTPTPLTQPR
jgi:hypothetical protein